MKFDKRLLLQIRAVRLYLIITLGISTLIALLVVAQAHQLSTIINAVFLEGQGLGQLKLVLGTLLAIMIVRAVLIWGNEVAASRLASHVKAQLRDRLFAKLLTLGPHYTQGERSGELTHTLVEGVESLDAFFSQFLPQVFLTIIVPLIIVITVFSVDLLSGIVLLVTAPILPFFMVLIGSLAEALTRRQWRLQSLLSAHFLDVLQGLTTLKLFGRTEKQKETIARISDDYRRITMKVLRVAFLSSLVLELGGTLSTAIIAVEIGLRLLYGGIAFEQAFFVLLLAPEFYLPLRNLGLRYHAALNGSVASQRIFQILDRPVPVMTPNISKVEQPLAKRDIRLQDVSYAYTDERQALNGISFEIKSGHKVALVGPSGAGKSTIAHLLLRFIEADSGQITLNETSLQEISAQDWRQQVAWVPQRPYLFNASVIENIRLGCPEATLADVMEAARKAYAHEFIQNLPQGYDTLIGEHGARLSGGQAQRLSLARAFVKNAPFLILDEATSNLDPEQESLVLQATDQLMADRTVLIIAHRLSTIYSADEIVVLSDGRVVEVGSHIELLHLSGLYSQLVNADQGREEVA